MHSFYAVALTALTLVSTASAWTTSKSFIAQGAALKAAGDPLGGSGNYIIQNVQTGLQLSFYRANGVTNLSPVVKGTPVQIQLNTTIGNQLRIGNGIKCASAQWNVYNDSITPSHDWAMVSYACKVGAGNLTGTATLEPTKQWWYAIPYDVPIVPIVGNISPPAVKSTALQTSHIANATSTLASAISSFATATMTPVAVANASAIKTSSMKPSSIVKTTVKTTTSKKTTTTSKKSTTTTSKKVSTTTVKPKTTTQAPAPVTTTTPSPAPVSSAATAQLPPPLSTKCTSTAQCHDKLPSNSHQKCYKSKCTFGCNKGYKTSVTGTGCVKLPTKRSYTPRGPELEARFARNVVNFDAPMPIVRRDATQPFYIIPQDHIGDMVAQALTPTTIMTWGGYASAALMPWNKNDPSQLWVFIQQ